MRFVEAIEALNRRTNYEASGGLVAPSLDRMRALADLLDHPQRSYPSIHVTGTNGKGMTVAVAGALLDELGLAAGRYISPHLHSVRERIAFAGEPISEHAFAETYEYLAPYLDAVDAAGPPLTWFEAMTAMSWVYFADHAAVAAVVEVGMGGEHDATNLVDGRVAVITKVALDHRELGETTIEIAEEKAGIIKHDAIVLTADRDPRVVEVLRKRCAKEGATLRRLSAECAIERRGVALGGQALDIRVGEHLYTDLFIPAWGEGLAEDAALGLAAVDAFLGDRGLDEEIVYKALAGVRHPGRVEVLQRKPLIVADGAHNADAAAALVAAMTESFTWQTLRLVIGMLTDHFTPGVLEALLPLAGEVIVTQPSSARAMTASALADEIAAMGVTSRVVATVEEACDVALSHADQDDAILITGSLYTVAAAREHVLEGKIDI